MFEQSALAALAASNGSHVRIVVFVGDVARLAELKAEDRSARPRRAREMRIAIATKASSSPRRVTEITQRQAVEPPAVSVAALVTFTSQWQ